MRTRNDGDGMPQKARTIRGRRVPSMPLEGAVLARGCRTVDSAFSGYSWGRNFVITANPSRVVPDLVLQQRQLTRQQREVLDEFVQVQRLRHGRGSIPDDDRPQPDH